MMLTCLPWVMLVGVAVAQNSQMYKFKLGGFDCMSVSDGSASLGLQAFYPQIPDDILWKNREHYNYVEKLVSYFNVLLCNVGDKLVMVDSGTQGWFLPQDSGYLYENLLQAGIKAEDIKEIIITHGHVDHFGGLITKDTLEVLYPNARVWIPDVDQVFYTNESNKDISYWYDFGTVFGTLEDAGIVIQKYSPGYLFEGFEALDIKGHSPGHTVIKVSSDGSNLYYAGDVLFNEVTVANPEWPSVFDMLPEEAVKNRLDFINIVTNENALVMGYHINFPGLGYIEKGFGGYNFWIPIQYQF